MVKKLKTISVFLIIAVVLSLFYGCTPSKNVLFFTDGVKYDLVRSDFINKFGFNIHVLSKTKAPKIEFTAAEGINTEYIRVDIQDDTFDDLKGKKYNGYYIILLGLNVVTVCEETQIDAITLSVDGEEQTIRFKTPVKNRYYDNTNDLLFPMNMPMQISTASFEAMPSETKYRFTVGVSKNLTINSFRLTDFLVLKNAEVYINDQAVGTAEESFPLAVKEGDSVTVVGTLSPNNTDISQWDNVYFDIFFNYTCNGKTVDEPFPIVATGIGSDDEAATFCKYIVSAEKSSS